MTSTPERTETSPAPADLQRAQQICADTLRDLPDDTELDVAFAEFKRRLGINR